MGGFNLTLHFYNGAGDSLVGTEVSISARDGRQKTLGPWKTDQGSIVIPMPLIDTISNVFTLNASARGYCDAGYMGFREHNNFNQLHLMLVERKAGLVVRPERWSAILSKIGQDQFRAFSEQANGLPAACLLNVLEAIRLCNPQMLATLSVPPLEVDRLETFRDQRKPGVRQDRVLLKVQQPDIEKLLVQAGFHRQSALLHGKPRPDEEAVSYKQQAFPYGNLQFTLFTKKTTLECYADIDMDYHRDKVSHAVMEVLPNFFGSRTDPRKVYGLRWMASKNAFHADFEPAYELAENLKSPPLWDRRFPGTEPD